ncbi:CHAD domain-containing protein [Bremerella sp. T1]|uniref:CHAD domain-containing protein n=1 Tax=Bremerella sp. TYQ1 TaxID=3119568 RepID=UPI001CC9360B|nr:CHAD domain-containing protein [Bremerella volcania]UBM34007.1 CHAD domain-containing protein [Bremerella volcania]
MTYQLVDNEPLSHALRRIAREQIDQAIAEIDDKTVPRDEAVHQVRKRCKKIRGLVRLVRPEFEKTYQAENKWYRDIAARLSDVRDAQVLIETYDKLMERYEEEVDRQLFGPIRRKLTMRLKELLEDDVQLDEELRDVKAKLEEGRDRIPYWPLDEMEPEAIMAGIDKTYQRGLKAMKKAYKKDDSEQFHEWRKRVKYHWYHMRLIRPIWQREVNARRKEADDLADLLGDDHDLAVLRETIQEEAEAFAGAEATDAFVILTVRRQRELRAEAKTLGMRLFAESDEAFAERLESYLDASQYETERATPPEVHPELTAS